MKKNRCKICNTPYNESDLYCSNCGAKIDKGDISKLEIPSINVSDYDIVHEQEDIFPEINSQMPTSEDEDFKYTITSDGEYIENPNPDEIERKYYFVTDDGEYIEQKPSIKNPDIVKEEKRDEIDKNQILLNSLNTNDEVFKKDNQNNNNQNSYYSRAHEIKYKNNVEDKSVVNFVIILAIVCVCLMSCLYIFLNVQAAKKMQNQYISLSSNPTSIPLLHEPTNINEMKSNFKNVERFLELYLRFSKDDIASKTAIFNSYLTEMNKLPHINSSGEVFKVLTQCQNIQDLAGANLCTKAVNKQLNSVGITAFIGSNGIYLYPDYRFINRKYSKYLDKDYKKYLSLRAKYPYPVALGENFVSSPLNTAKRIGDFEKYLVLNKAGFTGNLVEEQLYNDFRAFIFTKSIYNPDNQQIKPEFKQAYKYYIRRNKNNLLTPLFMSYLEKEGKYSEKNFKNDYPYKIVSKTLLQNINNLTFGDVFSSLRNGLVVKNQQNNFAYIFDSKTKKWQKFSKDIVLNQNQFIISGKNENNNLTIYDSDYSKLQDLNISADSRLFSVANCLYIFNSDSLSISQINFNGSAFQISNLQPTDASSIFPGINVINIDSFPDYNIDVIKENENANYIILSRYSHGFSDYELSSTSGNIERLMLPNMFSIKTNSTVNLSFHSKNLNQNITSDVSPTYKISVSTLGSNNQSQTEQKEDTLFDDMVKKEDEKIEQTSSQDQNQDNQDETTTLEAPPSQTLSPPND